MTQIVRSLTSDVQTAIRSAHTQPIHLVQIDLAGETLYLSEGREIVYNGHTFREGAVKVSELRWGGDGSQSCSISILNEDGYAANLFLNNQIADAPVSIWTTHVYGGLNTAPLIYATGACDSGELSPEEAKITVVTSKYRTAFMPNYYMGSAGFNHIPPEGAVVIWNSTGYTLERSSG